MTSRSKRVTIRTVAEDADVSVAAVSKVLRNSYGVSERMRAKVEASIKKLDYRPLMAARGMRGRSYTVGVLQTDLRNPYIPDIYDGIYEGFEGTGIQPLLGVGRSMVPLESALINSMIDRQMDGLILISPRLSHPEVDHIGQQIPTCAVAFHPGDDKCYDTANFNDQGGARLAVEHLLDQGCRNIHMLSLELNEPESTNVIRQRELGFLNALAELTQVPLDGRLHFSQFDVDQTRARVRELLSAPNRPDGLFCWSDMIAVHVFAEARDLGLQIPKDLAVVGYDNTYDDQFRPFGLTSLDQPGQQLGKEAARLLIERIHGRSKSKHSVFEPELLVRGSSQHKA